jgi:hypothetical protein
METEYKLDGTGLNPGSGRDLFCYIVHIGTVAHPASFPVGAELFPHDKSASL